MAAVNQSRRLFLRGNINSSPAPIRPPWSNQQFESLCNRCNDCIQSCMDKIITSGDGGYPEMNFSQSGCDACEACLNSCKTGALSKQNALWQHKAQIKSNCLSANGIICRSCSEACEQQAIHFQIKVGGIAQPILQQELCDGCGFCYALCPNDSIELRQHQRETL